MGAYLDKMHAILARDGDVAAAWGVVEEARSGQNLTYERILGRLVEHDFGGPVQRILCAHMPCAEAADRPPPVDLGDLRQWRNHYIQKAGLLAAISEVALAGIYYDSAITVVEALAEQEADVVLWRLDLALAYARRNRPQEALREVERAVELSALRRDALVLGRSLSARALVYALVGESDMAIQQLDELLSRPSPVSVSLLRLDPLYEPLRLHPRFQALLAKYEN